MATIQVPIGFKTINIEELDKKDVENLFIVSDSVNKLQQYMTLKSYDANEIIKILSVSIDCK